MTGIRDPWVIDLVAQEEDGAALLVIVESQSWTSLPKQANQLKAKLNTYTQFILDGSLARQYPELDGRTTTIRLDCAMKPPEVIQDILRIAGERLSAHRIQVTHKVSPGLRSVPPAN